MIGGIMRFDAYVKKMNNHLKENPDSGKLNVTFASDPIGVCFSEIGDNNIPTEGYYMDSDFINKEQFAHRHIIDNPNSICIN